jgi:hypothetical protein
VTGEDIGRTPARASNAPQVVRTTRRRWYGKRVIEEKQHLDPGDEPELGFMPERRPAVLLAPLYNGMAAGLSLSEHFHFIYAPQLFKPFLLPQFSQEMASVSTRIRARLEYLLIPQYRDFAGRMAPRWKVLALYTLRVPPFPLLRIASASLAITSIAWNH